MSKYASDRRFKTYRRWLAGTTVMIVAGAALWAAQARAADFPLSWDDPVFATNQSSGALTIANKTIEHLTITETGPTASVQCNENCTLNYLSIHLPSREGIRCVSGQLNINWSWVEVQGVSGDHADGLQCYSPGSNGTNVIKNTTFRAYSNDATAGYWSADDWRGTHSFENVLFWGGPYGLRIPYDGGTSVRLKNVYFVQGSFGYGPFLFDTVNGKDISILQWENVRWATIRNGTLVPGALIPCPMSSCGSTSTSVPSAPSGLRVEP